VVFLLLAVLITLWARRVPESATAEPAPAS
jgi:hypothetical protein